MQSLSLNLRSEVNHTSRKWFLIIVILFVVVMVTMMWYSNTTMKISLAIMLVMNLVQAFVNYYTSKPLLLTFDEQGIQGKAKPKKDITILWNTILSIEFKMFSMNVRTKDGKEEEIDLSHITYEDHKKVKPQIVELAKSKGIAVQTA